MQILDKDDPLVTVIVPIYKVEKYINHCIKSITSQSYANLQIILVDDGSPDECPMICDKWAEKDDRITVIHKKNGGLSDARNAGLEIADGKYIVFVDSDDYIHTDMITKLYDAIIENNADLAVCNYEYVQEDGAIKQEYSPIKTELLTQTEYFSKLQQPSWWFYTTAWNKLYKREIFQTLRFPVGKVHEDVAVVHWVIDQCNLIAVSEEKLYYYVQRNNSIMSSRHSIKRMDEVEAMIDRYYYYQDKNLKELGNNVQILLVEHFQKHRIGLPSDDIKKYRNNLLFF